MRDSSSVRLTWSLDRGPGVGGVGVFPRALRPATFSSYSACSRSKRS